MLGPSALVQSEAASRTALVACLRNSADSCTTLASLAPFAALALSSSSRNDAARVGDSGQGKTWENSCQLCPSGVSADTAVGEHASRSNSAVALQKFRISTDLLVRTLSAQRETNTPIAPQLMISHHMPNTLTSQAVADARPLYATAKD